MHTEPSDGPQTHSCVPVLSVAQRATLGWSKTFSKNSSLYHHLPGTPLQLRDDGKHIFVKVGDHTAIEAEPEGEQGAKGKVKYSAQPMAREMPIAFASQSFLSILSQRRCAACDQSLIQGS